MRAVEDFRNFYLTQRAVIKGRRNALWGDVMKKQLSDGKWNPSVLRYLPMNFILWRRERRDSWSDMEVRRMVKAQWQSGSIELAVVRDRSLTF